MMRATDSAAPSRSGQVMLLAPSETCVPHSFQRVDVNPEHHERMLASLQRLRGRVYLQDGAIEPSQLSADGRHMLEVDNVSWHLVSVQSDGSVTGCARYRAHDENVQPEDLGAWTSGLAHHDLWRRPLRHAIEGEIEMARKRNLTYVEVGGWAITEQMRFTLQAVDIALSTYALARKLGGCIGITTATMRNHSSRILRKIGGRPLEYAAVPLPSYYDPHYKCEMELLRFDSDAFNAKFQARIDSILSRFSELAVVCAKPARFAASFERHTRPSLPAMNMFPTPACA